MQNHQKFCKWEYFLRAPPLYEYKVLQAYGISSEALKNGPSNDGTIQITYLTSLEFKWSVIQTTIQILDKKMAQTILYKNLNYVITAEAVGNVS